MCVCVCVTVTSHIPTNPSSYLVTLCNATNCPFSVAITTWMTQTEVLYPVKDHPIMSVNIFLDKICTSSAQLEECDSYWSIRRGCLETGSSREACSGRRRDPPHEADTHRSPAVWKWQQAATNQTHETADLDRFSNRFSKKDKPTQHLIHQRIRAWHAVYWSLR